jgi:hypothetical protein
MSIPTPPGSPPSSRPPLAPRVRGEKDEKDEKDEKQNEKEEKEREEKWRRDPLSAMVWAAILIWAGVVLLLNNLRLLAFVEGLPSREWSLIFAGAGVIILVEVLIRLVMPQYRKGVIGSLIVAFVFIGIGAGGSLGWGLLRGGFLTR